jgi:hypothetical protein
VNHDNFLVGELNPRVQRADGGIVPVGNPTEEDARKNVGGEFQFGGHARDVVRRYDRSHHCWDVENLGLQLSLCLAELIVGHGHVTGPKIHRGFCYLADSTSAANGLIVDLNIGMDLVVLTEPLGVNGIGKCCACSVQRGLPDQRQG